MKFLKRSSRTESETAGGRTNAMDRAAKDGHAPISGSKIRAIVPVSDSECSTSGTQSALRHSPSTAAGCSPASMSTA